MAISGCQDVPARTGGTIDASGNELPMTPPWTINGGLRYIQPLGAGAADHAQAKALIEKLMESRDPADRARMVAQAYLTEAYERSRWPRRAPSLPDLLTYLMDQHGLSRSDLIPLLGTASRVSEVLTGKRELSMSMVRKLRERFHIPADLLIPPLKSSEIAA